MTDSSFISIYDIVERRDLELRRPEIKDISKHDRAYADAINFGCDEVVGLLREWFDITYPGNVFDIDKFDANQWKNAITLFAIAQLYEQHSIFNGENTNENSMIVYEHKAKKEVESRIAAGPRYDWNNNGKFDRYESQISNRTHGKVIRW